jgi:two-component system, OmpR family, sensor histidine kinase KdpD
MEQRLTRKTPDEYLRDVQPAMSGERPGYLKVFLGYASGAGKTFRMFDEARRRHQRGQDVVIGGVQHKLPAEVEGLLGNLDVVPLKRWPGGVAIDVDAIVRRHPAVCFIDGLAYDNPPGARTPTRWQDVRLLVEAGITVIGSVNVQYVEELREQAEAITGKHVAETVPVAFLKSADEIEVVDVPPEEAAVRSAERVQQLARLREMALVLAADVVDEQLQKYLASHGIELPVAANERLLVCITPRANVERMLDAAQLVAGRFHAELIAAYVHQPALSAPDQAALDGKLDAARRAGATVEILEGDDAVGAILDFAHTRGITQLFIGHSQRSGLAARLWGNPVERLIRLSRGMDIRIFPQ